MEQLDLLAKDESPVEGLVYRAGFISAEEERDLIGAIQGIAFSEVKMHGAVAKRRTAHFGRSYEFETFKLGPAPPLPDFLRRLRSSLADLAACHPDDFAEALVTEYPIGAGIGWHRDAPAFGIVAGVSLAAACTMRFRPWPVVKESGAVPGGKRTKAITQVLEPRSVYILRGAARSNWQHHIPPIREPRYSITFRTLRGKAEK